MSGWPARRLRVVAPHPVMRRSSRTGESLRLVLRLLERDGTRCSYCGRPFSRKVRPHLDHRVPRCRGGKKNLANLVLACRPCNEAKGDMAEAEFRASPALEALRRSVPVGSVAT